MNIETMVLRRDEVVSTKAEAIRQAVAMQDHDALKVLLKIAPKADRAVKGADRIVAKSFLYGRAVDAVKAGLNVSGTDAEVLSCAAVLQSSQRKVNALERVIKDLNAI